MLCREASRSSRSAIIPAGAMPVVGPVVGAVRLMVLAVTVIAVAGYVRSRGKHQGHAGTGQRGISK